MEYVAGFLISEDNSKVLLIEKQKPSWQKGKLNGIGGKIEKTDESSDAAMEREFEEETGLKLPFWNLFASLRGDDFVVMFYYKHQPIEVLYKAESREEETVRVVSVGQLSELNVIPNLTWLIPMAISMEKDRTSYFEIKEKYD